MTINKKSLSERDICSKYITPALVSSGWDLQTQVREEVSFTDGYIIVKGNTIKREKQKRSRGAATFRDRAGEVLFIDARKLGHMVDRVLRAFTNEDSEKIVSAFAM